jgi:hypothetical protein
VRERGGERERERGRETGPYIATVGPESSKHEELTTYLEKAVTAQGAPTPAVSHLPRYIYEYKPKGLETTEKE